MSTTSNGLADIEKQLDQDLANLGLSPETDSKSDDAKDDLATKFAAMEAELKALKSQPQSRYVGPEGEQAPPQVIERHIPTPSGPQGPRKMSTEQWAKIAQDDPVKATMEAFAAGMGMPEGSDPKLLFQAIAAQLQQQGSKVDAIDKTLTEQKVYQSADQFMKTVEGYEATPENSKTLFKYIEDNGLLPTYAGFKSAYALAVLDGAIEPRKSRGGRSDDSDDDSPAEPSRTRSKVPSLKHGTAAPTDADFDSIKSKLDKMSYDEARKYWEKFTKI